MIHARLRRLGYPSVDRGAFESFQKFKDAREAADAELLAILAEISKQTGEAATLPRPGEPPAETAALGEYGVWLSLKRLAAYGEAGRLAPALPPGSDLSADPVLSPYLNHEKAPARFAHLLLHAESQGYFVPFSFPLPFWVPEPGVSVGSAPEMEKELGALEEFLQRHAPPGAFTKERELAGRIGAICREAAGKLLTVELFTA